MADITLILSKDEFDQIIDAMEIGANDYAYRAEFEESHGHGPDDPDNEEFLAYQADADRIFDLIAELKRRRDQ